MHFRKIGVLISTIFIIAILVHANAQEIIDRDYFNTHPISRSPPNIGTVDDPKEKSGDNYMDYYITIYPKDNFSGKDVRWVQRYIPSRNPNEEIELYNATRPYDEEDGSIEYTFNVKGKVQYPGKIYNKLIIGKKIEEFYGPDINVILLHFPGNPDCVNGIRTWTGDVRALKKIVVFLEDINNPIYWTDLDKKDKRYYNYTTSRNQPISLNKSCSSTEKNRYRVAWAYQ